MATKSTNDKTKRPDASECVPCERVNRWEWEHSFRVTAGPTPGQRMGLMLLATFADSKTGGSIRPKITALSDLSGHHRRTIDGAISWGLRNGWLVMLEDNSRSGRLANVYALARPLGWKAPECDKVDELHGDGEPMALEDIEQELAALEANPTGNDAWRVVELEQQLARYAPPFD